MATEQISGRVHGERTRGFRYAVLGILSRADGGLHGWAIKRQCERLFGCVWDVNVGRVYRALDQLRDAGLIAPVEDVDDPDARRRRKVFRVTSRGCHELAEFLKNAGDDTRWAGRDEFVARFIFSEYAFGADPARLVDTERQRCMERLRAVTRRRRTCSQAASPAALAALVTEGEEMAVRARLAWLDRVARRLGERTAEVRHHAA